MKRRETKEWQNRHNKKLANKTKGSQVAGKASGVKKCIWLQLKICSLLQEQSKDTQTHMFPGSVGEILGEFSLQKSKDIMILVLY